MKNSVMLLGMCALMAFASCEKKTETTIENKDTTVVVMPPPAVETPESRDTTGTSIEVGKNGVDVDGEKTDVEVKDGNAKVEVK